MTDYVDGFMKVRPEVVEFVIDNNRENLALLRASEDSALVPSIERVLRKIDFLERLLVDGCLLDTSISNIYYNTEEFELAEFIIDHILL